MWVEHSLPAWRLQKHWPGYVSFPEMLYPQQPHPASYPVVALDIDETPETLRALHLFFNKAFGNFFYRSWLGRQISSSQGLVEPPLLTIDG